MRNGGANGTFVPWPLCAGAHRQTMLGFLRRRRLGWRLPTESVRVSVDADVSLVARVTEAPAGGSSRALVLVHGMGGSDRSTYILATAHHALARGWSVVRVNMRGSGDEEAFCPRLHNAGLSSDLAAVLRAVAGRFDRIAVAGFSLGGHLAALALARHHDDLPANLVGTAAVSPPLDLAACASAVAQPGNEIYQRYFMDGLSAAYSRIQSGRPDLYAAGRDRGLRTIYEFDEAITAPYGGYRSAAHYYETNSAGPALVRVRRPLLLLAAKDDPVIPPEGVTRWPLPASGIVQREVTNTGGHVGFVGRTSAPASFWAAERVLNFVTQYATGENDTRRERQRSS